MTEPALPTQQQKKVALPHTTSPRSFYYTGRRFYLQEHRKIPQTSMATDHLPSNRHHCEPLLSFHRIPPDYIATEFSASNKKLSLSHMLQYENYYYLAPEVVLVPSSGQGCCQVVAAREAARAEAARREIARQREIAIHNEIVRQQQLAQQRAQEIAHQQMVEEYALQIARQRAEAIAQQEREEMLRRQQELAHRRAVELARKKAQRQAQREAKRKAQAEAQAKEQARQRVEQLLQQQAQQLLEQQVQQVAKQQAYQQAVRQVAARQQRQNRQQPRVFTREDAKRYVVILKSVELAKLNVLYLRDENQVVVELGEKLPGYSTADTVTINFAEPVDGYHVVGQIIEGDLVLTCPKKETLTIAPTETTNAAAETEKELTDANDDANDDAEEEESEAETASVTQELDWEDVDDDMEEDAKDAEPVTRADDDMEEDSKEAEPETKADDAEAKETDVDAKPAEPEVEEPAEPEVEEPEEAVAVEVTEVDAIERKRRLSELLESDEKKIKSQQSLPNVKPVVVRHVTLEEIEDADLSL